jgi:cupin 2 domain-containing protein
MKRFAAIFMIMTTITTMTSCNNGAADTMTPQAQTAEENKIEESYTEMNIFDLPELPLSAELVDILYENSNVRIERIISTGQTTDWYDQDETEYVVLLEGNATIEYEDGSTVDLAKGDSLLLKPHEIHRVAYTSTDPACVWFCVFYE